MTGDDKYGSQTKNCYNSGRIYSDRFVGGIVGSMSGDKSSILYCYNIGTIDEEALYNTKGSITGSKAGTIQNCYYLNTSEIRAIENRDDEANNVYGLTDEYMKSKQFVGLLNSGNEEIVWKIGDSNYQYPMLEWQEYSEEAIPKEQLTGITISKAPTKTNYIEGQTFDKAGMVVTATYNDGSSKEVTNYTVTPTGALTTSDNKVTISYTENGVTKTAEQTITVKAKEEPKPILKGDANGDGKVDFMDILAINKHRLGKAQLTGKYLEAADVNGDSKVDFMDILQINKYRLGTINSL